MPVYVDEWKHSYGRMMMCHMIADTIDELHQMADKIGVARRWFQKKSSHPHYDICKSKRALAIKAGAIEVDRRGLVDVIRRARLAPNFEIGAKVRMLKDIFDDGEDHHPPSYLATAGEILVIRKCYSSCIRVSHEDVTDNWFRVFDGEFELA